MSLKAAFQSFIKTGNIWENSDFSAQVLNFGLSSCNIFNLVLINWKEILHAVPSLVEIRLVV